MCDDYCLYFIYTYSYIIRVEQYFSVINVIELLKYDVIDFKMYLFII